MPYRFEPALINQTSLQRLPLILHFIRKLQGLKRQSLQPPLLIEKQVAGHAAHPCLRTLNVLPTGFQVAFYRVMQ